MTSFKEVDLTKAYKLINPVAVVATKGESSYNLTPYGWIMPLDFEPVTKVIFSSDPTHNAVANIKRTKEFAVCIPNSQKDEFINQAGSISDAKADKFKMFNIKGEKANKIDVLIPKELVSSWIEFKFVRSITEGSVELIIGEAVAAYSK